MKRLTEKELAGRWGISVRTCQKWRRTGMGPVFIVIGQHTVLYREEDVRAYERAKRQGGETLPEPEGWRNAMKRAAAVLNNVSKWKNVKPEARETIAGVRNEINDLLEGS
jgi:hypothetical protein